MSRDNLNDSFYSGDSSSAIDVGLGQLVVADPETAGKEQPRSFFDAEMNKKDDSDTAFGNNFVPPMGTAGFSPHPGDPRKPLSPEEKAAYEEWLRATRLTERTRFRQHQSWQDYLNRLGLLDFSATVSVTDIPKDVVSERFRRDVLQQHLSGSPAQSPKLDSFLGRTKLPDQFDRLSIFVPEIFEPDIKDPLEREQLWVHQYRHGELRFQGGKSKYQGAGFDELLMMRDIADAHASLKASSMTVGKHRIAQGRFILVSDHNGEADGTRIQVWTGIKPSFASVSSSFGQNIGQVKGADGKATGEFNIDVRHLRLPNLTITQIADDEIGFCHNRATSRIEKMLPGRYVLQKGVNFIGAARVDIMQARPVPLDIRSHMRGQCGNEENERFRDAWAADISVLFVPPNQVAFLKTPQGTVAVHHREEPYVLNKRDRIEFVSGAVLGDQVCAATDKSYGIVALQQPGEYVVFKDGSVPIVWEYNAEHPELNTVHLSSAFFTYDYKVHNNHTPIVKVDQVTVFSKRSNELVVLEDEARNFRFLERSGNQPIVLREPWRYVQTMPKSEALMRFGQPGAEVVRVLPSDAEWTIVKSMEGKVEFFPPPLDGSAYYFYQPKYSLVGVVNRNLPGEQRFDVPGVGEVKVVNLETGQIGLCQLNNVNFLLSPSPQPYIFTPPARFFKAVSIDESYVRVGDLHRIYLRPDERCVVEKNGRAILLPDTSGGNELDAEESNGVYTFRAEKLEVTGPVKKSEKHYKLGPIEFFNVDVGEVAYGNKDGRVCIWHQGEHFVNNNRNEWFKGFFSTNVDPVVITEFEITSKHGVTSHIDIYVTYSIDNADLAINRFRTHDELHAFIAKTTESEILRLCATQPPIGYTEGDFTTTQAASTTRVVDREAESAEAMKEIEGEFATHASTLLKKYGIELGNMHITKWKIDPQFVEKSRALALGLQESRATLEQKQIDLQQQRVANDTEMLKFEQERQRAVTEAQKEADIQAARSVAEVRRQAEIAEAEARAKVAQQQAASDAARIEAEQRKITAVLDAETEAYAKTAGDRAQAQAQKETASAALEAAKMEAQRIEVLANAQAKKLEIEGKADAAVIKAKVEANYPGASGDKLIDLEIARMQLATRQKVAEHTQMVVHTRDPEAARRTFNEEVEAAATYRDAFGMNNPFAMMQAQASGLQMSPASMGMGMFGAASRLSHLPQPQSAAQAPVSDVQEQRHGVDRPTVGHAA